jgi:hypothetical protein
MSRENCPQENIGRVFGAINSGGTLEGSVISSDYCIVEDGSCQRHISPRIAMATADPRASAKEQEGEQ